MIPLSVKLKRLKPADQKASEFNAIVRDEIAGALEEYQAERVELHFGPSATRRYGRYWRNPRRSLRYLIQQARTAGRRAELTELYELRRRGLTRVEDPSPLENTGTTRGLAGTGKVRATATANKQRGVLPLPTGHPINPAHVGELSTTTQEETAAIRSRVIAGVKRRLKER